MVSERQQMSVSQSTRAIATLPALMRVLSDSLLSISVFAAVGLLLAVVYLHTATYYYSATLTVVATQQQNQNLGSQFGELASLAGINAPSSQDVSPFSLYPDAVISRVVADDIARTHPETLHRIFSKQWNEKTNTWLRPSGLALALKGVLKTLFGIPAVPWTPPGGAELREVIEREVSITLDNKKPILTMTYRSPDPAFAKRFLDQVNESTDSILRRMTLDRSSKYANYIEKKLSTVQAADLRQALINSYSQQETLVMMSSSNTPFAAQPLGVTVVSLRPVSPQPIFALILGLILGIAIGAANAVMEWHLLSFFAFRANWRRTKSFSDSG